MQTPPPHPPPKVGKKNIRNIQKHMQKKIPIDINYFVRQNFNFIFKFWDLAIFENLIQKR